MCSLHCLSPFTFKTIRHDYMQPSLIPIFTAVYCTRDKLCNTLFLEREDRFDYLVGKLVEHIECMMSRPTDTSLSLMTDVFLTAMDQDEVYRWIVDDMWRRVQTNQDLLGTSTYSVREQHCMDRMRNFRDFMESYCIANSPVNIQ
jgi:NDP-sugar pyrophosphorylase family protein